MFYIDGTSDKEIGVVAEEENFLSRAPILYEEIIIDGKDGSEFVEKNFTNVIGTLVLYLIRRENLDVVKTYFNGIHELMYDEKITNIHFYEVGEIVRYGTTKSITLNFIRSPFWHKKDYFIKVDEKITNEGTIGSRPIFKLKGTANTTVDLTIAGIRFKYHFDEDNEVIIDCDQQEETYNGISKSKNIEIGFEYPILQVGSNDVAIHAGTCEIYVMRKDAWL